MSLLTLVLGSPEDRVPGDGDSVLILRKGIVVETRRILRETADDR